VHRQFGALENLDWLSLQHRLREIGETADA